MHASCDHYPFRSFFSGGGGGIQLDHSMVGTQRRNHIIFGGFVLWHEFRQNVVRIEAVANGRVWIAKRKRAEETRVSFTLDFIWFVHSNSLIDAHRPLDQFRQPVFNEPLQRQPAPKGECFSSVAAGSLRVSCVSQSDYLSISVFFRFIRKCCRVCDRPDQKSIIILLLRRSHTIWILNFSRKMKRSRQRNWSREQFQQVWWWPTDHRFWPGKLRWMRFAMIRNEDDMTWHGEHTVCTVDFN